ncbi:hypothetical protein ULMS_06770 [Patiriisocius marinistellae]|uniref:Uncharacterized protein n=1 Tax=Patiriisocius marinistellae TaxID=2494560 RepID=A0A5J4FYD5_9FLAO|nr:hypothetical protein [Patiriisocius marinistellae]GEQ85169.1 hypothetical protein ULMS_06770 [Patiriisocius marinistellae]
MALHKILKIVALVLSVAGIVLWGMIVAKGDEAIIESGGEGLDAILYVAYITFAIVLVAVLIFVIKGLFEGNIKKTLVSLGAFVLIFVIAYVLAGGVESVNRDGEIITAQTSKWIGTGLYAFYIMAILAIIAMVFSGVKKLTTR